MGPGIEAKESEVENAHKLGILIAQKGWITLTGGRNIGVMDAALKGAKEAQGLTIGILPSDDQTTFSNALDIPIITNMRSGRNYLNVLSSDIIIACGMNTGTASEVSLALQSEKSVILLNTNKEAGVFFTKLKKNLVYIAETPQNAIKIAEALLKNKK